MSHKTTIKDIARELGISIATVSRALTGSHEVKSETRESVMQKANELRYRPNLLARNLQLRRNNMIGVVVPEFITFYFPEIIIAVQEIASRNGFQVLICQSGESSTIEKKNIEMLEDSGVEGLIVSVAKDARNIDLFERLIRERMPLVFVNRVLPELDVSRVIMDDRKWAFKSVEHLIKCGYRHIAHLAGNEHLSVTKERLQGYFDALNAYHIPIQENLIMYVGIQQDRAKIGVDYLLSLKTRPDAIFAVNDPIAVGSIIELRKHGFRVPEDFAVAGFTESPTGQIMQVTSVKQPTAEIGRIAAEMLLAKIRDYDTPNETIILDGKLNIRQSSLPVHKRRQ
ncbi:MAG: LacI family transcriptional regulator [Prevotella sp.]|nr:LacI family transcriptional regulator [Prevotella sp.]